MNHLEGRRQLSAALRHCIEEIEHLRPQLEAEFARYHSGTDSEEWDSLPRPQEPRVADALQVLVDGSGPDEAWPDVAWPQDWEQSADDSIHSRGGVAASARDEAWRLYARRMGPLLRARPREFWSPRWRREWRPRVARACCYLAASRFAQEPYGPDLNEETFLWLLAFEAHGATAYACSEEPWLRTLLDEHAYAHARHRLADVTLHSGLSVGWDFTTLSLAIETFVVRPALPMLARGWSHPANLDALLQKSAQPAPGAIGSTKVEPEDAQARLSLCYRLKILGYRAPWLDPALVHWKSLFHSQRPTHRPAPSPVTSNTSGDS